MKLKKGVKNIPFLGDIIRKTYRRFISNNTNSFTTSGDYWERRYKNSGTSGAGSYGRLAQFKADVLNEFVEANRIDEVLEFGCGDGAQLSLANYNNYIGIDVSRTAIEMCREKFKDHSSYKFYHASELEVSALPRAELTLSLDVIFHLVEDIVFDEYMKNLFAYSKRFVIIFSYNFDKKYAAKHERGRQFTNWIKNNELNWKLIKEIENPFPYDPQNPTDTSQAHFFFYERRG